MKSINEQILHTFHCVIVQFKVLLQRLQGPSEQQGDINYLYCSNLTKNQYRKE